jgi:hypothetical protein
MAFWAPLLTLGVGEVAVKADSLSWVSPDVDAEQLEDAADAAVVSDCATIGPMPKRAVAATVQATNRPFLSLCFGGPNRAELRGSPSVYLSIAPLPFL